MLRFSSKYGIVGCSLHFEILPTSGFTGISDLTKMYSGIWHCVVIRRGTFTPHRECPALMIVSGRQVQLLPDRPQRRLCCRFRFQRATLLCQAPGSRQGKSRRVGTPDLSQRLSSKSMAISSRPILYRVVINRWYSDIYANRPEDRGGRKPSKCP